MGRGIIDRIANGIGHVADHAIIGLVGVGMTISGNYPKKVLEIIDLPILAILKFTLSL